MTFGHRRRPARPSPTSRRLLRSALLLAAALTAAAGSGTLAAQDDLVRLPVPALVGMTPDAAREVVRQSRIGTVVEVLDTVAPAAEPGTVVRQEPAAGVRAVVPARIRLWVAGARPSVSTLFRDVLRERAMATPETLLLPSTREATEPRADTMPDLRGRPVREGVKLLQVLGIESVVEGTASSAEPGTVVQQRPAAGVPIRPGQLATLFVADGRTTATVPRVLGEPLEEARRAFAADGIQLSQVDTVTVDPDRYVRPPVPGTVLRQLPAPGSTLEPGATGRLWIAVHGNRAPSLLPAPDVLGLGLDEARERMDEAGLVVTSVVRATSDAPARSVVEQKPAPGVRVPPGTEVALAVSEGPRIVVPTVVGLPLERAGFLLTRSGLEVGAVSRSPAPVADGEVVDQSPVSGTSVPAGAAVDLTVAATVPEPQRIPVPEVVGRPVDQAEEVLFSAGLTLGGVEPVPAEATTGTVVGQWPPSGGLVAPGEAIRLDVSTGVTAREPVAVPEVVGLDRAEALQLMRGAGLTRIQLQGEGDRVAEQFPSPGTSVEPGSPVLLTLQAQGFPVALPGWLGRWQAWGLPAGLAALWALLRARRLLASRRAQTDDPSDPEPEEAVRGRVEYRLTRRDPTGSLDRTGPLVPRPGLSLRPRPPRTVRATLEVPGEVALDARPPSPPSQGGASHGSEERP